ncbi:MAG: DUF4962 domain-containing protein [Deltaproteobacteria bacterium]|nr:DUF4962 domain-containing protein [Deltaproteobacteria bacterium]
MSHRNRMVVWIVGLAFLASATARAEHPQTVFDAAELVELQATRSTTRAALASNLKAYLDRHLGASLGRDTAGFAIAAVVFDDPTYTDAAVSKLMGYCPNLSTDNDLGQGGDLLAASIAYDVLYDLLTQAQRDTCRGAIAACAANLAQAIAGGIWWVGDMVQNHNWVNHAGLGLAGQALEGEHADAAGWRATADANFAKISAILNLIVDGSWHEGIGYMEFGLERFVAYFMGASRRGNDGDLTAMLGGLGRYILSMQQPNHPRVHVMTHGDWNWSRPGLLVPLRWAARRFQDPHAQEAGRRWDLEPRLTRAEFGLNYGLEYVAYDPEVPVLDDMSRVPLDLYAADQQAAILRSSWHWGADATTIVAGFKTGVLGGRGNYERIQSGGAPGGILNIGHDHMDDLGLWIYGNGGWLLPETVAYNCCSGGSFGYSSEYHNVFLFDGQGQLGDDRGTNHSAVGNSWFFAREASMPLHESTAHYGLARGDGAKLYPSSLGVQTLLRTIALVRDPGYLVLHDRVVLTAARTVEQLFHSMGRSGQAGPWVKLVNLDDSVLGIRVIAPAPYEARISSQQSNHFDENMDDDGAYDLIKVTPAGAEQSVVFLEALWPTKGATWDTRPQVQPLDGTEPQRGFAVALGASTESWVYGTTGATATTAGDLTLEGGSAGDDIGVVRAAGGSLQRLVLVGRGRLEDQGGGRTLLDLAGNQGALEVAFTGARADLSGTAAVAGVRFYGPDVTDVRQGGIPVVWTREGAMVVVTEGPALDGGVSDAGGTSGSTDGGGAEGDGTSGTSSGADHQAPGVSGGCGCALRARADGTPMLALGAVLLLAAAGTRRRRLAYERARP